MPQDFLGSPAPSAEDEARRGTEKKWEDERVEKKDQERKGKRKKEDSVERAAPERKKRKPMIEGRRQDVVEKRNVPENDDGTPRGNTANRVRVRRRKLSADASLGSGGSPGASASASVAFTVGGQSRTISFDEEVAAANKSKGVPCDALLESKLAELRKRLTKSKIRARLPL